MVPFEMKIKRSSVPGNMKGAIDTSYFSANPIKESDHLAHEMPVHRRPKGMARRLKSNSKPHRRTKLEVFTTALSQDPKMRDIPSTDGGSYTDIYE